MTFEDAIEKWEEAQRAAVEARVAYERAYAEGIVRSDGKSAEIRKAQADLAALDALRVHELAIIEAKALEYVVMHLSGADAGTGKDRLTQDANGAWRDSAGRVVSRGRYEGPVPG